VEYLLSIAGVLPWRCEDCETRFSARSIPFRNLIYAHCRICGNLDLQRISAQHVPGAMSFLGRILNFPALRCVPCRNKFFSFRPVRRPQREAEAAPGE
jgi:hypothetical protein